MKTIVFAASIPLVLPAVTLAQGGPGPGFPPVPVPASNPITTEKANLGKVLFWDEQLSSSRVVSCGTCHIPTSGGSDPRSAPGIESLHPGFDGAFGTDDDVTGSPGVIRTGADLEYDKDAQFDLRPQVTGRKAPSMINAAFSPTLFWDGRAEGPFLDPLTGTVDILIGGALENQAVGPILDEVEMGHAGQDWSDVSERLASVEPLGLSPQVPPSLAAWIGGREYPELFTEAFGSPEITPTRIARAIATYERTLVSDESPATAAGPLGIGLSPLEQQGQMLFGTIGRCNACHAGPLFTDNSFRYIGVRPIAEDLGRGAITGNFGDNGRMKVPSLLNVELRGPYFHTGTMQTLEDVVDFYDRGGDFDGPTKDPLIAPIGLNPQEKTALVAFLRAMTDPRVENGVAPFDRPALFSGGGLVPSNFGFGSPGADGFVPRLFSIEPPKLDNPDFTVAIELGLGGAPAVLAWDLADAPFGSTIVGVPLHLALTSALGSLPTQLEGVGAGEGYRSHSFVLPDIPTFAGLDLFAQAFVLDDAAPTGVAATSGLRFTLF